MSLVSIVLTSGGLVTYELMTYPQRLVNNLTTTGEIIGTNSTAALAFGIKEDAEDNLKALSSQPSILSAAIYNNKGERFATYTSMSEAVLPPQRIGSDGATFTNNRLVLTAPIHLNGTRIGTIFLESNLEGSRPRLRSYGVIVFAVFIVAFSVAIFIGSIVQRRIYKPILALANTAYGVTERKDYSIRAEKASTDEFGDLADAFNEMLREIQSRDIELRKSEHRYRSTLDHMLEGCQIIDYDWRYLYLNDAAVKQSRREREELLNQTMMQMYPGIENTEMFFTLKDCMTNRIPHRLETEFYFPDGSLGWFALSIEPVPEGIFILSVDVTKERELTGELKKHQEHLEELVRQRTFELDAANKELEAFSYSVSHDLRAPLRSIDGFSQVLLENYNDSLDDRGRDYLRRVRSASQRMAQLIDDLLNLARLTRMDMKREEVNLSRIAENVTDELRRNQPQREIEIEIEPDLVGSGDPRLLKIALENLLNNAWKYSRKKPRAKIEFKRTDVEGRTVFFVRDNGAGFDMAYADKLFGAFQRLHRSTEFEGTGIGLATVSRIIKRHGGKIWAEASTDQGATFYFAIS